MKVDLKEGKYVLAVSGGVDSIVLLDLLAKKPNIELVVAHFNHGIRDDSDEDEALIKLTAARYDLPFESAKGKLGNGASEATARTARYKFLEGVRRKHKATAIITAHHQDDLIETALLNLLRGTGRRGIVAMAVNPLVVRPLLGYSKTDLLKYAREHSLRWREDDTNFDNSYARNYVRHHVTPGLSIRQRHSLISNIDKVAIIDKDINYLIAKLSQNVTKKQLINRRAFTALPVDLGNELVLFWLRQKQIRQPDKKTVGRLNVALRASKDGTVHPVSAGWNLLISRESARFSHSL